MTIRSFRHAGLERLYRRNQTKGVPSDAVEKLRRMLSFLQAMETVEELRTLPHWKAHRLTGDRAGIWALHVTRNWRLTFQVVEQTIIEVNYEDYHGD